MILLIVAVGVVAYVALRTFAPDTLPSPDKEPRTDSERARAAWSAAARAASEWGVSADALFILAAVESSFDPTAVRHEGKGVYSWGALQLSEAAVVTSGHAPEGWKTDLLANMRAGAAYLNWMTSTYGSASITEIGVAWKCGPRALQDGRGACKIESVKEREEKCSRAIAKYF